MTLKLSLWCVCGDSMSSSGSPHLDILRIGESFRATHAGVGHDVTEHADTGRKWVAAARRRGTKALAS